MTLTERKGRMSVVRQYLYLGMVISELGAADSMIATIDKRTGRVK